MYYKYMAWTPPTKYLRDKELTNDKRLYRLISKECNFVDPEFTYLVYMAMVSVIGEELRRHQFCRLPHLGDFALVRQKARPAWCGRMHVVIGPRTILKFYPKEYLRRRFNQRQGFPRYTEILPPKFIK